MTFFALLNHVLGLLLPAVGLAVVLMVVPRLWPRMRKGRWSWQSEAAWLAGS